MEVLTPFKKKSNVISEIQAALRVYFPRMRFSMKTCNDKDYKVIEVSYTDGVSLTRVKNAVRPFECPANPAINFQGTRILIERKMSRNVKTQLLNELNTVFKLKCQPGESDWCEPVKDTAGNYIRRIFTMRDFE
jgi:hypothetical protein